MSQYRITSADFISPGESLVPDAILSDEDKQALGVRSPNSPTMSEYLNQQIELRKNQSIQPIDIDMPEQKPNV